MRLTITEEDRIGLKKVFANFGRQKTKKEVFYDLCFCICAPQTTFKNNRKVIDWLMEIDFYGKDRDNLPIDIIFESALKPVRFYRQKAKYLWEAKKKFPIILKAIYTSLMMSNLGDDEMFYIRAVYTLREWLVKNVKGLGMKTASHFLRNLGDTKLAIIDTHILKFLNYKAKKGISKNRYLELENQFREIAKTYKLTPAELDAVVWKKYSKTSWDNFKW